jgi:myo-inositol-1(or 4)-monophosphatase
MPKDDGAGDPGLAERLSLARELAETAGRAAAAMPAGALRSVARKGLQDFVTLADKRVEETLRARLAEAFPEDGFLGEESGGQPGAAGAWVVDPIDGTTNYIRGLRHWGVSIAFLRAGRIELGCL